MTFGRGNVLLIEDDPDDEFLTCRVLRQEAQLNDITVVRDGAEALDYLFGEGAYLGRDVTDLPMVILLDLNLPKIGGLDVLKAIRTDPRTKLIPVVIMSSSSEEGDRLTGYANGANSYVVKPVLIDEFSGAVRQLGLYWLMVNALPPLHRGLD